ncbi:cyclodeaminase/cyclohydrolase family protein [Plantibacter sp. VKM Ac-2885]|uniref:cyclodeaminase/cyclohydrolase family protein n=1 Tax=Plantibacter sp. VKM Ac-2885 TaxID=2783828 RepID=UPI00188AD427|nr:cyclodeaminase/cyclohydrolase family protein [Plantibacter sp. VKM Ac-2885]MBF4512936.1 cyclodeaminase/cyclohydrolase family protein [Plantibacter sp. VKM Ac-2885]
MTGSADTDEVSTEHSSVSTWMQALGTATGNPGGGAASGLMLAIAAGLTAMVAGYTRATHATEDASGRDAAEAEAAIAALRARAEARSELALRLADEDAHASRAFGSAFRLPAGVERDEAIRAASIEAAAASARLGEHAVDAIDDLAWLTEHGNPALIADVAVAIGALRAAITGARTNVSFDLGSVRSAHGSLQEVRADEPRLWELVAVFDRALERIDRLAASIDSEAAPTDAAS